MKFFNTAGPNKSDIHFSINPLTRWNLQEILDLIENQKYFVLHAPRQTGKTTCMLALMDYLNKEGKYTALYANIEASQGAREDVSRGIMSVVGEIASRTNYHLKTNILLDNWKQIFENFGADKALTELLTFWAINNDKPIVLFLDEIDALVGDTLISVLRQIRSGYDKRPVNFPQSIILCGVRDVRDYRIHSEKEKAIITGGSAFNIKAESLRLGNFTFEEIADLYYEHTKETGQKFEVGIIEQVMDYTGGQPWLVNALAYEVCSRMKSNRDRSIVITKEMLVQAKENLILRRDTHLDQLIDKLKEERVKNVIQPMLQGIEISADLKEDDARYVADLGLINLKPNGKVEIANSIYREIIPRELSWTIQTGLSEEQDGYIDHKSGKLDILKLLTAFQSFFRRNSDSWIQKFEYQEAGPQLLLQAFLQRILNGGGRIEREYGLGKQRTDLYILWKYQNQIQEIVIELKIKYDSLDKTIEEGLSQTFSYMDKCATDEGHLIIFDRSKDKTWEEKIFQKDYEYNGKMIKVWGM